MFKRLKIKNQHLLLAGALLLLMVAYRFAFVRTAEAWQLHKRLQRRILQTEDISYQPGYLERRNHNLDKILQLYKTDTINYRSNLLSLISLTAQRENVKLAEVPSVDPLYHTQGSLIEKLRFEGDYFSLLRVQNRLQQTRNIGVVESVDIKTVKMLPASNESHKIIMDVYLIMSAN